MQAAILASAVQKDEWMGSASAGSHDCVWVNSFAELTASADADIWVDLLFENNRKRIEALQEGDNKTVIINAVADTLTETDVSFIRMNAWPGFLKREITEAAGVSAAAKERAESFFVSFGKRIVWTADQPGFITARVIAMIINEAYLALGEGVSSKEEMDTAMKLGTNYPYGPFEWAGLIGLENINHLLMAMSRLQERYTPAPQLKSAIENGLTA